MSFNPAQVKTVAPESELTMAVVADRVSEAAAAVRSEMGWNFEQSGQFSRLGAAIKYPVYANTEPTVDGLARAMEITTPAAEALVMDWQRKDLVVLPDTTCRFLRLTERGSAVFDALHASSNFPSN